MINFKVRMPDGTAIIGTADTDGRIKELFHQKELMFKSTGNVHSAAQLTNMSALTPSVEAPNGPFEELHSMIVLDIASTTAAWRAVKK